MKIYSATITDRHGDHMMLFRAYRRPGADTVRRCLRLVPTAQISLQYIGDIESLPLVTAGGPLPVFAPGPGRASS